MLSSDVIIWCYHLFYVIIWCYHLFYVIIFVIIYCYHFPPFFFFLKTWHTQVKVLLYREADQCLLSVYLNNLWIPSKFSFSFSNSVFCMAVSHDKINDICILFSHIPHASCDMWLSQLSGGVFSVSGQQKLKQHIFKYLLKNCPLFILFTLFCCLVGNVRQHTVHVHCTWGFLYLYLSQYCRS